MTSTSFGWARFPVLRTIVVITSVALVVSAIRCAVEAHVGFSLWNPGFLWHGVQRVFEGDVPARDFMAWPPGSRGAFGRGRLKAYLTNKSHDIATCEDRGVAPSVNTGS